MMPAVSDTPATSRTAYIRDVLDRVAGRFYTPDQLADRLNVTTEQVGQLARTDRLPGAVKIGGSWRFHADQFEAWTRGWWDPDGSVDWETWRHQYGLPDNLGL